jgi:hypothetical protein
MEPSSAVKDAYVDAISSVQCSKIDVPPDVGSGATCTPGMETVPSNAGRPR